MLIMRTYNMTSNPEHKSKSSVHHQSIVFFQPIARVIQRGGTLPPIESPCPAKRRTQLTGERPASQPTTSAARVSHLHLVNSHLRARRAASHRLQQSGPVPDGDRARLARCSDMWTWDMAPQYPSAIERCSVRALGSLGTLGSRLLLLSISSHLPTPCSRLGSEVRSLISVSSCSAVAFRRSFRLSLVCERTLGIAIL